MKRPAATCSAPSVRERDVVGAPRTRHPDIPKRQPGIAGAGATVGLGVASYGDSFGWTVVRFIESNYGRLCRRRCHGDCTEGCRLHRHAAVSDNQAVHAGDLVLLNCMIRDYW